MLVVKNLPANAGDARDTAGGAHGNQLQCSCRENPMDRGAKRLQPIGSQRVGHEWSDLAHTQLSKVLISFQEQVLYLHCLGS